MRMLFEIGTVENADRYVEEKLAALETAVVASEATYRRLARDLEGRGRALPAHRSAS